MFTQRNVSATVGPALATPLLSSSTVAYHFCQGDNSPTSSVAEFVHSLAAQLSQAPQLSSYHHLLQSDQHKRELVAINSCHTHPAQALKLGVLQPLSLLYEEGKISSSLAIILIDGLCEAEQHRPDYGGTVARFLLSHSHRFPPWLRLVITARTNTIPGLRDTNVKCFRCENVFISIL